MTTTVQLRPQRASCFEAGTQVAVANTYEARDEGVTVYNFEVEGGHTYFVADDQRDVSAVWVHNRCNLHHSIPKFLGGHSKQILVKLDVTQHRAFEKMLAADLKGAGIKLNIGGRGGSRREWANSVRENPRISEKRWMLSSQPAGSSTRHMEQTSSNR